MPKLLSVLLASIFATGVYAQSSVTTRPGDAMGPTGSTAAATSSGASASKGTPLQGDQKRAGSAETTRAGEAMGPTDTVTHKSQKHSSASKKKSNHSHNDSNTAETTRAGDAMGSTQTTDAAKGGRK